MSKASDFLNQPLGFCSSQARVVLARRPSLRGAIALARRGKRVLLVSTDPASNLDEVLGVQLSSVSMAVPGATGLSALNIDPEAAARRTANGWLDRIGACCQKPPLPHGRTAFWRMHSRDRRVR